MAGINGIGSQSMINPYLMESRQEQSKGFSMTGSLMKSEGIPLEKEKSSQSDETATSITTRKELSDEDQKRLEKLQDMLNDILLEMGDSPSEAQKRRVREIEKEMEDLTGVKTKTHISDGMNALNKAKLDKEKDEEKETGSGSSLKRGRLAVQLQLKQRDLHTDNTTNDGPGIMNFLQKAAAASYEQQEALGTQNPHSTSSIGLSKLFKDTI